MTAIPTWRRRVNLTGDARDEIILWDQTQVWIYTQDRPFKGRISNGRFETRTTTIRTIARRSRCRRRWVGDDSGQTTIAKPAVLASGVDPMGDAIDCIKASSRESGDQGPSGQTSR